ncbi:MAG TPA: GTPase HflX, partial [Acidimicrobiia bacterium]|nr:GTPase HflX [Acidimicrobiia bacterium]
PELIVFNKADVMSPQALKRLASVYADSVAISALKGTGLEELLMKLAELLERTMVTLTLEIPYSRGDVVAAVHRVGEVIEEKHDDNGMIFEVRIPEASRSQFVEFTR